ncbi:MAG: hypothetical protein AAGI68_15950 [Planctomycetota bacterium]
MAITVREGQNKRRGGGDTAEREFLVEGTSDPSAARLAAIASAGSVYDGKDIRSNDVGYREFANGVWVVTVPYGSSGSAEPQEVGDQEFSFDIGATQVQVYQSLETVSITGVTAADAIDRGGAIEVSHDGRVAGTQITVPTARYTLSGVVSAADMEDGYDIDAMALVGTTNASAYQNRPAGSCLLVGVSGRKRGDGAWNVRGLVAFAPNKTNLVVGGITVPSKKGWEHVWVYKEPQIVTTGGKERLVQVPKAAYVERLYEPGDWSVL